MALKPLNFSEYHWIISQIGTNILICILAKEVRGFSLAMIAVHAQLRTTLLKFVKRVILRSTSKLYLITGSFYGTNHQVVGH